MTAVLLNNVLINYVCINYIIIFIKFKRVCVKYCRRKIDVYASASRPMSDVAGGPLQVSSTSEIKESTTERLLFIRAIPNEHGCSGCPAHSQDGTITAS